MRWHLWTFLLESSRIRGFEIRTDAIPRGKWPHIIVFGDVGYAFWPAIPTLTMFSTIYYKNLKHKIYETIKLIKQTVCLKLANSCWNWAWITPKHHILNTKDKIKIIRQYHNLFSTTETKNIVINWSGSKNMTQMVSDEPWQIHLKHLMQG